MTDEQTELTKQVKALSFLISAIDNRIDFIPEYINKVGDVLFSIVEKLENTDGE